MTEQFIYQSKEIKVHLQEARGKVVQGSVIIDGTKGTFGLEEGGNSQLNRMFKNMGVKKMRSPRETQFSKIMKRFNRQDTMKSSNGPSKLKTYRRMFSIDNTPKRKVTRLQNQTRQLIEQRNRRYAKHYLQLSLIEKYLSSLHRANKTGRRLKSQIQRSHQAQTNNRSIYQQQISPRLNLSMQSPVFAGRKQLTPPRTTRAMIKSQDAKVRPIFTPPHKLPQIKSPKSVIGTTQNTERTQRTEASTGFPRKQEQMIRRKGATWGIKLISHDSPLVEKPFTIKLV